MKEGKKNMGYSEKELELLKNMFGGEDEVNKISIESLQSLLNKTIHQLMLAQRNSYLKENFKDIGNGYQDRTLNTPMGKLKMNVPRTREGFRPTILPDKYQRSSPQLNNLIQKMINSGYKHNQLKRIIRNHGLNFPNNKFNEVVEKLEQEYKAFINRDVPEDIFCIFIDGKRIEMKEDNEVKTYTVYSIIGIDLEWKKNLYGFYIKEGIETKGGWLKVLNDLITRGLRRVSLIVSDDFSGLKEAIKELFPKTDHQLCVVHLKRNIRRNMGKEDAKEMKRMFDYIKKNSKNFKEAMALFEKLLLKFKNKYKSYISTLWAKKEHYLNFIKYPRSVRKYIYTTNTAENFNTQISIKQKERFGFFQSRRILGINMLLYYKSLKKRRWNKPVPRIKGCAYKLYQKHRSKFSNFDNYKKVDYDKINSEMEKALEKYDMDGDFVSSKTQTS